MWWLRQTQAWLAGCPTEANRSPKRRRWPKMKSRDTQFLSFFNVPCGTKGGFRAFLAKAACKCLCYFLYVERRTCNSLNVPFYPHPSHKLVPSAYGTFPRLSWTPTCTSKLKPCSLLWGSLSSQLSFHIVCQFLMCFSSPFSLVVLNLWVMTPMGVTNQISSVSDIYTTINNRSNITVRK